MCSGLLYILGGLIRCIDLASDLWYLYSQEFESDWLYYGSIFFILSPSVILFLIFFFWGMADLFRLKYLSCLSKIAVGIVASLLDPLGLVLCFFGCMLFRRNSKQADYYVAEALTRTSGFIEGIFESLPQLLLQTYNNLETENWDTFTVTSVALSAGGFIYSCIKLIHALDQIKVNEDSYNQKKVSQIVSMNPVHVAGSHNLDQNNPVEVYDYSEFSLK